MANTVKDRTDPESLLGREKLAPVMENGARSFSHRPSISPFQAEQNKVTRKDAKYRKIQSKIYNFLERPRGYKSISYHVLVFLLVFTCLALSVFSTIEEYEDDAGVALVYMESTVVTWFAVEFLFRLWSAGCRSRYQGVSGRLKFARRPFCIIDIITICASVVVILVGTNGRFAASALRILRFFQILRMVRMDRRGGTWKLLGSVVYAHRQELITTLYIGFLGLIFTSFLVYLAEKDTNDKFSNFANALWWGVITLCTVGYGDVTPITWQGKLIASGCAIMGISFFALPAGILGSGFALKVQQQQRQKHMIRRRQPAATLIQSVWRCYAAEEYSGCTATWKIHEVPLPSPPANKADELREFRNHLQPPSLFKHNASFVTRLPTIRRKNTQSPSVKSRQSFHSDMGRSDHSEYHEAKLSSDEEDEPRCTQLTNAHKIAIRAIRKLKLLVSRRRFREAQRPYDVKDVIEQYSQGHADLLGRVRSVHGRFLSVPVGELLENAIEPLVFTLKMRRAKSATSRSMRNTLEKLKLDKLDQILGKQGSKAKDVYESKLSLASRVVKVERQVDDIETKLDHLIEMYMSDRIKLLAMPTSLDSSASSLVIKPPLGGTLSSSGSSSSSTVQVPPKRLLLEERTFESAPSTPIVSTFPQRGGTRPILQRGMSDVSQRIRKKVTLQPSTGRSASRYAGFANDVVSGLDEETPLINGSVGISDSEHPSVINEGNETSLHSESSAEQSRSPGHRSLVIPNPVLSAAATVIVVSAPDS